MTDALLGLYNGKGKNMQLTQIDVTGCRIIGSITGLGNVGPKHHAIILGLNESNGYVYVAESMHTGYQIASYQDFYQRYASNGEINISANDGKFSDLTVAQRALEELKKGGKGVYNLIANNCESFSNRAMHGRSTSKQVIHTFLGIAVIIGTIWVIKKAKKS